MTRLYLAQLLVVSTLAAEPAEPGAAPRGGGFVNPDFEQGEAGQVPPGWFVPKVLADQGFQAILSSNQPRQGAQCLQLFWPEKGPARTDAFANVMQRIFITDGSAISYAETIMGIIEAYRLGEIVGEPTAGTTGNIAIADLPLGYRMVFTGMRVLKHDGSRHHGVGIRPTVPVSRTIEGIRAGRDEQLGRALSLLESLPP